MYLYVLSYESDEEDLYKLEMKSLFNHVPDKKYVLSDFKFSFDRSPYFKRVLEVLAIGDSVEELAQKTREKKLSFKGFKIKFLNIEKNVEFDERHRIEGVVGFEIVGKANVREPEVLLGVTLIEGKWILGKHERGYAMWEEHNRRPHYYSNSLSSRMARSLVNIAVWGDPSKKLLDPCCGIGTVIFEALSMGIDIEGMDINPVVVEKAKKNLEYLGYEDVIQEGNIHEKKGFYDALIIDLPYGLLSISSRENQAEIISSGSKLTNRMVIVSMEDFDKEIEETGFKIIEKCDVVKGKMKRIITLCEKI